MGPTLVWTVGLFLSGMDAPPRTEGSVPCPSSRQIGPQQIGPSPIWRQILPSTFLCCGKLGPLKMLLWEILLESWTPKFTIEIINIYSMFVGRIYPIQIYTYWRIFIIYFFCCYWIYSANSCGIYVQGVPKKSLQQIF